MQLVNIKFENIYIFDSMCSLLRIQLSHFKSQIGFFKVILPPNTTVSEYRLFFASPKNGGFGRDGPVVNIK